MPGLPHGNPGRQAALASLAAQLSILFSQLSKLLKNNV
jgi:hypothetical protein